MSASAAFQVNSATPTGAVAVSASSTVNLALLSTSGVNSVAWSIVGNHDSSAVNPTITPAGSPSGATASFPMPAGAGQAYLVQCVVNGGVNVNGDTDAALTKRHIVGVVAASGLVPLCVGETTERQATHGWTEAINSLTSATLLPALGTAYKELRVNAGATALEYTDVPVVFAPVQDWATFIALVNAQAALGRAVQMGPGTWTADAAVDLASNAQIFGGPDVVVDATIGVGGGPTDSVFVCQGAYSAGNTTLSAAATAGTKTVSVAALSFSGGTIALGSTIIIQDATNVWLTGVYTVIAAPTGGGPYTLTLDRPVFKGFGSSSTVKVVTSRPENIHIDGRGMLISGAANRYIEFACAKNCVVENLFLDGSLGNSEVNDYMASFDIGGQNNVFRRIIADGNATNAGSCLELESNEGSQIIDCMASNNTRCGIELIDCVDCKILDSKVYSCDTYGINVSGETVGGSYATTIRGCTVEKCGTIVGTPQAGICVQIDSADTIVDDCTVIACGNAVGLSGGILLLDTVTRTVITKCRVNNGTVFAGINIGESGVTATTARDVMMDGNLVGFVSYGGDYLLDGFRITNSSAGGATTGALGVSNSAVVTKCTIRNGYISVPNGNGTYGISWPSDDSTARMYVDNVHISLTGAGTRVAFYHKTGVARVRNLLVDGAGAAANYGSYANGGTIHLLGGCDLDACGTPLTGIHTMAQSGAASKAVTGADVTLSHSEATASSVTTTGILTGNRAVILPTVTNGAAWDVFCNNTGAFTTTFKTAAGTGVVVAQTKYARLMCDGTNIVRVSPDT